MTPRIWLITGATAGFGAELVRAALDVGDSVVAGARHPEALDGVVAASDGRLEAVQLDVTESGMAAVVDDVVARHGRIDVLVNAAGRGHLGAVEEATDAEFRDFMELHFHGPVALIRAALPHLRAGGGGWIVQFSSMGGRMSFPGVGVYSASKFALEGLSEALAGEVAPFGIRVLVVEPGAFRTSFNRPGASVVAERRLPEYEATVGGFRDSFADGDGSQPGDPAKAADAILAAMASDDPPFRLVLGDDAAAMVGDALERERAEFAAWQHVARSVSF